MKMTTAEGKEMTVLSGDVRVMRVEAGGDEFRCGSHRRGFNDDEGVSVVWRG